jgi:4-carboxymuconolactone decarboxylase
MRFKLVCIGALGLIGISLAVAQGLKPTELNLRGGRFAPLTYDQMTPQQKTMIDHILAGPRGARTSLDGPFNVYLRSPEMGDKAQDFGASTRPNSVLPAKLSELAVAITARYWNSQYVWAVHGNGAKRAGMSAAIIDAIAAGKRPTGMQPDEEAVYNFSTELLNTKQVSDATFAAMKDKFGEHGIVDLIGVICYYQLVSAALNVDRYPLAPGQTADLKPLK